MIGFDFEYYKPGTLEDATSLFKELSSTGKKTIYYGGGTEFISMARMHNVYADAVIDIKGIPECNIYAIKDNELVIGSAVTLTNIAELNLFPLLSLAVKRIADHTIQDKITLGGNIAGTIIYKEAILALMVSNSHIILANADGQRRLPLKDIFNKTLELNEGEIIVQFIINKEFLSLPHLHVKRTKNEKIDYPLMTLAALKKSNKIQIAFSGVCEYPFRSLVIEDIINDDLISDDKKTDKIISNLPDRILNDLGGSSEYRGFMLETILLDTLEKLKEAN